MELHLRSHHWSSHRTDWIAAAVSGLAAGALLMVVELCWAAFVSNLSPWVTPRSIAAIAMGPEVLGTTTFGLGVVTVALVTHYVLGVAFGLIVGFLAAQLLPERGPRDVAAAGALIGAVLYGLVFYVLLPWFPWFVEMRGLPAFTAHVLFGIAAALMYRQLERRSHRAA